MLETTKKHDGSTNSLQCNLTQGGTWRLVNLICKCIITTFETSIYDKSRTFSLSPL